MASQVLSGTENVSYTNNTGQNVRIVINYMRSRFASSQQTLSMSWAGVTISSTATNASIDFPLVIGRNLAFTNETNSTTSYAANNFENPYGSNQVQSYPTEIMLAAGQTFSTTSNGHNIVIIPEGG